MYKLLDAQGLGVLQSIGLSSYYGRTNLATTA